MVNGCLYKNSQLRPVLMVSCHDHGLPSDRFTISKKKNEIPVHS